MIDFIHIGKPVERDRAAADGRPRTDRPQICPPSRSRTPRYQLAGTEASVAKLTLNGVEIEAADGAPLVEVIKNSGIFISNLCYIDGLPPYAGCRTCLVEIEGARGLPALLHRRASPTA